MLVFRKALCMGRIMKANKTLDYDNRTVNKATGIRSDVNRCNKTSSVTVQENIHRS
jgi:hypothetical protein